MRFGSLFDLVASLAAEKRVAARAGILRSLLHGWLARHDFHVPRRRARPHRGMAGIAKLTFLALMVLSPGCGYLGGTHGDPTSFRTVRLAGPIPELAERLAAQRSASTTGRDGVRDGAVRFYASANRVRVAPDGDARTIAQAAALARDGDIVEIQAGVYEGDVAVWTQRRLRIRAVGGRVVLRAAGRAAEGKAIWVLRDGDFEIDGFDFVGTRVPGRNGAGIRFERGSLVVRNSRFLDNQMGLLTGNHLESRLVVDHCEFSGPADGTHWYHNLYVGRIAYFEMTNSWSRDARKGHLVKSRARENVVTGNRLVDGGGTASYELEFPEGGLARVRANRIEQSVRTDNPVIVSYGAEGYRWPDNALRLAGNTLVNRAGSDAVYVRVAPGPVRVELRSNVWAGPGRLEVPDGADDGSNRHVRLGESGETLQR